MIKVARDLQPINTSLFFIICISHFDFNAYSDITGGIENLTGNLFKNIHWEYDVLMTVLFRFLMNITYDV